MQYQKTANEYVIVLQQGENVIETLTRFCTEENIENAYFRAMGAVEHVSCGYYALDEKRYYFKQYDQLLEVASATGNIMLKEGVPFVHLHAIFTDTENNAFGGHVEEMRVGVTLEVILTPLASSLTREHDDKIGLFLISCPQQA
ncbi:MAG: PPC domain-containing DNA-binding protein [Candidatus Paceibacterota bacterium]